MPPKPKKQNPRYCRPILPGQRLITRKQAAFLIGVHPQSLCNWAAADGIAGVGDRIPIIRLGGTVRYDIEDVHHFIDSLPKSEKRRATVGSSLSH